ncbi:CHAT domain-containing protein [Planktothricoides raciborskii]|uniref:CHAT domain-containing protein n=1 Tax=Planktothricoides raciborskii TaxID=132608 RepID=UPI001686F477|nr:CHAT domain-containing protein [Planktothricoides raciborskii]MBD2584135.1 CHAT domain-containing protein [Planktothricoides raciborskii FACHB-1261]
MSLRVVRNHGLLVAAMGLLPGMIWQPVVAQTIVPGGDTGTQVIRNGDRLDIQGGALSGDGSNLFHTFEQFNVPTGETANFLSAPQIQNILGQVVGGNASIINGILQVTGSNANLFLLNPAGIVFGPNATLNVPGAFTATTANGVGFNGGWFGGTTNDYQALVGSPNSFIFATSATSQPGVVFNAGNLAVGDRQSLNLIGGMTVNTGSLSAPGGQITIAAVPGETENLVLVRINQSGMLLSLDILPSEWTEANQNPFLNSSLNLINPLTLPELLTGGNVSDATNVTINPDGTVSLTGSTVRIPTETGTTIVSGQVSVSTEQGAGGSVTAIGDKVGAIGAQIDASGSLGGGDVRIGGDYQGNGLLPTAARTFVSNDAMIRADASSGNGGRVIVWADELTGFYGQISARGGENFGNGGFAEVSGKENLIFNGLVDLTAPNGIWGTLLLDPKNITISNAADSDPELASDFVNTLKNTPGSEDITISVATLEKQSGDIVLEATDNITIAPGVSLTFNSASSVTFTADSDNKSGGAFSMDPTQSITASGADVEISGAQITVGTIDTSGKGTNSPGGDITLTANGILNANSGNITTGQLNSSATGNAIAGTISLTSTNGDITVNADVKANEAAVNSSNTDQGTSGNIILTVNETGNIDITNATLNSSTNKGTPGTIDLITQGGDITTGALNAGAASGTAGDINIDAASGLVNINDDVSSNNLTIRGAEIDFTGGPNFVDKGENKGERILTLTPWPDNPNIEIGLSPDNTANTPALDISQEDLKAIASGFNKIIIGDPEVDLTGTITLGLEATFRSPVQIQGGSTLVLQNPESTWDQDAENNGTVTNPDVDFFKIETVEGGKKNPVPAAAPVQESPPLHLQSVLDQDANDSSDTTGSASPTQVSQAKPETTNTSQSTDASAATPVSAPTLETATNPPLPQPATESIVVSEPTPVNTTPEIPAPVEAIAPPITEAIAPPTTEAIAPPTTEAIAQPATEAIAPPITEAIAPPITEAIAQPATEAIAPPITEAIAPPITEAIAPPITEAIAPPTTEAIAPPITEAIAQPATEAIAQIPSETAPVVDPNNPGSNLLNEVNIPEPTNAADFSFNTPSQIDPIYPFTQSREPQISIDNSLSLSLQAPRLDLSNRQELEQLINSGQLERAVQMGDRLFTEEFWDYLRPDMNRSHLSFASMQLQLQQIAKTTGNQTAIIYVFTREKQLDLIVVPPLGKPIYKNVAINSKESLLEQVEEFQNQITDPIFRQTTTYLPLAKQLYQLIISPLEEDLKKLNTDTLIFSVDAGLRTLPLAALNDGEKFLIEKYSLSLTPSLHLLDARYHDIQNSRVLAMGISEFPDKNPLPAVPVELQAIAKKWSVETIFGQSATLANLRRLRSKANPSIIHIATHAQFKSGQLHNSYIQLSDQPLHLDQMPELNWNNPPVELLVLSACRTAIGDQETEYGFAGLAVQAGVKSALASLWYANDAATLGLMSEFYAHLRSTPIKAEGLRQAQIAMLQGELSLTDGFLVGTFGQIELPPALKELGNRNLNHPYYWSGFTMIGSPW